MQLVKLLPEDSAYFRRNGIGRDLPSQQALASIDPAFGWNFLRALKADDRALPQIVMHPQLRQANAYLDGADDEIMDEVLSIAHPINTTRRNLLKGLLVSTDVTLAGIARFMRMPLEAARLFDQLLFNVRDRMNEPDYLAQIINPGGIVLNPDTDNEELLLLQAGSHFGAQEVIRLAQIQPVGSTKSLSVLRDNIEREILDRAATCSRYGGEQAFNSPAMNSALKLLVAEKRSPHDEPKKPATARAFDNICEIFPVTEAIMRTAQMDMGASSKAGQPNSDQETHKLDPNWARFPDDPAV